MKKLLLLIVGAMTVLPGCDWCCWRKKKCCDKKEMREEGRVVRHSKGEKSCCARGGHHDHMHE